MDGASAASTAIGLLKNLKEAIDLLRLYCRRVKTAHDTLNDIQLSFDTCYESLNSWMVFWGLNRPLSRYYQDELWGKGGSQTVLRHLAKISNQMEDVRRDLTPILTRAGITKKMVDGPFDGPSDGGGVAGSTRRWYQLPLPLRDTIWFARGKGEDLATLVALVARSVAELHELSDLYFCRQHGSTLREQAPAEIARVVGLAAFLRAVVDARSAASMVFDALFGMLRGLPMTTAPGTYPKLAQLELDTVIKPQDVATSNFKTLKGISLRYHLSVGNGREPLHVLVDGPLRTQPAVMLLPGENAPASAEIMKGAYYEALQASTTHFTLQNLDGTSAAQYSVRRPLPHEHSLTSPPDAERVCLTDLLRPLPTATQIQEITQMDGKLTRSARILLAHQIVAAGLFLCGSPWFSRLSNGVKSISRLSRDDSSVSLPSILDVEVDAKTTVATSLQTTAQHMYLVGLLLIELGLGQPVRRARRRTDGELSFVFDVVSDDNNSRGGWGHVLLQRLSSFIRSLSDALYDLSGVSIMLTYPTVTLSESEVLSRLSTAMGEEYTTAARQCINKRLWMTQSGELGDVVDILSNYWSELYLRLEKIRTDIIIEAALEKAKTQ